MYSNIMLSVLKIGSGSTAINERLHHTIINTTLKHLGYSYVQILNIPEMIINYKIQNIYVAQAAQGRVGQALFPYTRLDRRLISQLNAQSLPPSLSYTPLCYFSNPLFFSLSCFFFFLSKLSFSRPQSLPEPWSISLFLISHTIHCRPGIFRPTPLSPQHLLVHFLILAHFTLNRLKHSSKTERLINIQ